MRKAPWITAIFYNMSRRRREFPCKGPDNQVPKEFKSVLSNNIPIVSTVNITRVRVKRFEFISH
jgi:hypothetical protein